MKIKNLVLAGAMTLSIAKSAEAQTVVYESDAFRGQVEVVVGSALKKNIQAFGSFPHDTLRVFELKNRAAIGLDSNVAGLGRSGEVWLDPKFTDFHVISHELGHSANLKTRWFDEPIKISEHQDVVGMSGFMWRMRNGADTVTYKVVEEAVTEYLNCWVNDVSLVDSDTVFLLDSRAELTDEYVRLSQFIEKCVWLGFFTPQELYDLKVNGNFIGFCRKLFRNDSLEYSPELFLFVADFFGRIEKGESLLGELYRIRSNSNFLK